MLLLHLAITTPILYDFYNYDLERPEFAPLFIKFTENVALFGALIVFHRDEENYPNKTPQEAGAPNPRRSSFYPKP